MKLLITKLAAFGLSLILSAVVAMSQVVVSEITAPSGTATGLCWDGEALWVSDYSTNIWRINPANGAVLKTLTGPTTGSDGLAWDNGYLWTISGSSSDHTIYKIDTTDGSIVSQIIDPASGYAGGMTWDGSALWVSQYYSLDKIFKIDPATQETLLVFNAPGVKPYGLAYDGTSLWHSSEDGDIDRIYRLNPANGQELWSFELPEHTPAPGRRPRGLAWDGTYLWVLAYGVNNWDMKVHQYNISNADNPDIDFSVTTHNFGSHVVGFPETWNTTATNIGNVDLVLDSAVFLNDVAFHVLEPAEFPVTLASETGRLFILEFDPPTAGVFIDSLAVYSNDPDENPFYIVLTGTGLPDEGDIDVDPTIVDFGTVRISYPGLSTSRGVKVMNVGTGVLTVSAADVTGEGFSMDPLTGAVDIDSSSHTWLRVWFAPMEARSYDGTLRIISDDPDEGVFELPLMGIGYDIPQEGGEVFWHYTADGYWENGINSIHWINDVNGDGIADVLAASDNHLIYCLNGESCGTADTFWTYDMGADPNHSGIVWYERGMSACPDLTGDGVDDVLIGTSGGSRSVYALSGADGTELWMFDTRYWGDGGWVYEVYPIEDVNGDFITDVVAAAGDDGGGTGPQNAFCLSGADGQFLWASPSTVAYFSVRTIADVTGDGIPDVVAGDTDAGVIGLSGATGAVLWGARVGTDSPVFTLVAMGNANPQQTSTEDVAVASWYEGVYCLDGGNGAQIWFTPTSSHANEVIAVSDITGDAISEVCVGTSGGRITCMDGASGTQVWSVIADPQSAANVLSMAVIPDVNGDRVSEIIAGTLGDYVVLIDGWDGTEIWSSLGQGQPDAVDAVGILPDIDNNGSWEILAGNRYGVIQAFSGGLDVDHAPVQPIVPSEFSLGQNYPNPFNLETMIPYSLANTVPVTLSVYDILGRRVTTLVDAVQQPGEYSVIWSGKDITGQTVASGIYFIQLHAESFSAARKIVLLK